MIFKFSTNSPSFTLIEVLVTVAIISIITGMGIASYRTFDSNRKIESATIGFATFLRSTQKKADAGERTADCNILNAYRVILHVDPITMTTGTAREYIECSDSPSDPPTLLPTVIHILANQALFNNNFKVTFLSNGKGVNTLPPYDKVKITRSGSPDEYEVSVSNGGAITVQRNP